MSSPAMFSMTTLSWMQELRHAHYSEILLEVFYLSQFWMQRFRDRSM